MRYKVFIKPCKQELKFSAASGGLSDSTGAEVTNANSLRTGYFESIESDYYTIVTSKGLAANAYFYADDKSFIGMEQILDGSIDYSGYADYQNSLRAGTVSFSNRNIKYVRIVLHTYDSVARRNVDINLLKASALNILKKQQVYLIHDDMYPDSKKHLISPKLSLSDNAAGSFSFTMPPVHDYYSNGINVFTDTVYVVRVYDDGSERIIWDGRPLEEKTNFDKTKEVYCEGALAYLNDTRVPYLNGLAYDDTIYEFAKHILDQHNMSRDVVSVRQDRTMYYGFEISNEDYKKFGVHIDKKLAGASIYINRGQKYEWWPNFEGALQWFSDYIIGAFGGHMKVRYLTDDTVNSDIIARRFTMIQSFDYTDRLPIYSASTTYSAGRIVAYKESVSSAYRFYKALTAISENQSPTAQPSKWEELTDTQYQNGYADSNSTYYYFEPLKHRFPSARIDFGDNLIEYTRTRSINDICTRMIPRGKKVEDTSGHNLEYHVYLDTPEVTLLQNAGTPNEQWVKVSVNHYDTVYLEDVSLIRKYGIVEACVDFEDAETPRELMTNAKAWFKDLKSNLIEEIINVNAVLLEKHISSAATSDPLCDQRFVDLWTKVYVTYLPLDLKDELYYVTAIDIPLDDPAGTTVTLTNKKKLVTEASVTAGTISGTNKGIIDKNS